MVRLVALAALTPALALGAAHRFASPIALQLINLEVVACARPLAAGRGEGVVSQPGHCLTADLAVAHRDDEGRLRHDGVSYLLERGFAERVALDFGAYAPAVLRELGRTVDEDGYRDRANLAALVALARKQIQQHVHYEVLPHVVLPLDIELAVARLADCYFGRARRPLVITSGPRTPESQALAMYLKLNQGASLRRLYRKTAAAQEIRKAYEDGRRARKRHGPIIADMAAVIRQQMERGVYVSPHLKGGAVDLRSRTMTRNAKAALQRAVASFRGMRLIREERVPPHFHLELWPVD